MSIRESIEKYVEYRPWMDLITIDDLPNDDLKTVAEVAGLETALALVFTGQSLTVSIPKESFKALKERYIMQNYDGTKYSLNKLALECNYTQRHIYKILNKNLNKGTTSKNALKH